MDERVNWNKRREWNLLICLPLCGPPTFSFVECGRPFSLGNAAVTVSLLFPFLFMPTGPCGASLVLFRESIEKPKVGNPLPANEFRVVPPGGPLGVSARKSPARLPTGGDRIGIRLRLILPRLPAVPDPRLGPGLGPPPPAPVMLSLLDVKPPVGFETPWKPWDWWAPLRPPPPPPLTVPPQLLTERTRCGLLSEVVGVVWRIDGLRLRARLSSGGTLERI